MSGTAILYGEKRPAIIDILIHFLLRILRPQYASATMGGIRPGLSRYSLPAVHCALTVVFRYILTKYFSVTAVGGTVNV